MPRQFPCPSAVDVTIGKRIYINLNVYLLEKCVCVHIYIYQSLPKNIHLAYNTDIIRKLSFREYHILLKIF